MNVKIGSDLRDMVNEAVASGRYASEEDVVRAGLRLVAAREAALRELKQSLEDALREGGSHTSEEVMANVRQRLAQAAARKHAAE